MLQSRRIQLKGSNIEKELGGRASLCTWASSVENIRQWEDFETGTQCCERDYRMQSVNKPMQGFKRRTLSP